jgi:hypothetical protein
VKRLLFLFILIVFVACFIGPARCEESGIPSDEITRRIQAAEKKLEELQKEIQELKSLQKSLLKTPGAEPCAQPPTEEGAETESAGVPTEERPQSPLEQDQTQEPSSTGPGSETLLNPKISLNVNFLWQVNHNRDIDTDFGTNPFKVKETEIAFQSNIDPFSRADIFLSLEGNAIRTEEAYATLHRLPLELQAKAGRFKASLGKNNTFHPHSWDFIDPPDVLENFLGEEGLSGSGISLTRNFALGEGYGEITLEGFSDENDTAFSNGESGLPVYCGKLRTYFDLSDTTNLELGLSQAAGWRNAGVSLMRRVSALDATFRWRPALRGKYHSLLVRGEALMNQTQQPDAGDDIARGWYLLAQYQMSRNWHIGSRYDYSELSLLPGASTRALSGILTYDPSEFMRYRLQYKSTIGSGVPDRRELWFQILYTIGPHGAHKF